MATNPLIKHKSIIIYGAALAALVFVLKWLEWRMLIFDLLLLEAEHGLTV